MRTAYNEVDFLVNESKELEGVCLGYDFCAEHEQGTADIYNSFGLLKDKTGIERLRIHTIPKSLQYKSFTLKKKKFYMISCVGESYMNPVRKLKSEQPFKEKEMIAAWDKHNFAFASTNQKYMKELYSAFMNLDILITIRMRENPFAGAGLSFAIISKLSNTFIQKLKDWDDKQIELLRIAKKTGIYKKLKRAGKSYYALKPRAIEGTTGHKSKYKVIFWLNPIHQNVYNSGWYTVEELKLWTKDKGPIMDIKFRKE